MTVLERMGEWLAATSESPLSNATRERLSIHLLDAVGAWLVGRASEEGALLARLKSSPGKPFPVFGEEALDRIAMGTATIRLTEIDDIHMPSCTTPSAVVVPTALAVASKLDRPSPETFAQALRAGYEVITRLGVAVAGSEIVYRGIWPTYLTAPVGASAVTSRLLGLDAIKTANALGIALTLTSGAPGAAGGRSPRWLLLGFAARAGCAAALAAAEGYAGDRTLLDDEWVVRTHGVGCDTGSLLAAGQGNDAVSALSLKPCCAAKQSIAAIDAFLDLLAQGISPDDFAVLRVAVPPVYAGMIGHRHASAGRIPRITSVAYNLALAAYRPGGLDDTERPDLTTDLQIAAFMDRVEVIADEALAQYYPERWPARVEAVLKSGRAVSSLVLDARGDPAHALDVSAVRDKFHRLVDRGMDRAAADQIAEACLAATEHRDALAVLCDKIGS
jgi:2-methylcitrate dehydratase PrpD